MSALADDAAALAAELEAFAAKALALAAALKANGWQPEELDEGLSIDRTTPGGDELHVGERVEIVGSDRYGDSVTAIVKGPGPDLGDGKQRVHVALENGENDAYTPSISRVHLTA